MVATGGSKVNDSRVHGAKRVLVLFPGSLGDSLCFLPALQAIARRHRGEVVEIMGKSAMVQLAQGWSLVSAAHSIDRAEVAQLFSPAPEVCDEARSFFSCFSKVYSWMAHGDPHFAAKLRLLVQGPVEIFPFYRGQSSEHAAAYYLRCLGETLHSFPQMVPQSEGQEWAENYWQVHGLESYPVLTLHPGSGSPQKQWDLRGFEEVLHWWTRERGGRGIVLLGPAEEERGMKWRGEGCQVRGLSLTSLAALLYKTSLYLGNDSGVSHLAGAMGAKGAVIFGPTRPDQWRPLGGKLAVIRNEQFRKIFPYEKGISLLEVSPQEVVQVLALTQIRDQTTFQSKSFKRGGMYVERN